MQKGTGVRWVQTKNKSMGASDKNLTPDALSMSNNKTCTDAGADKEQRYRQQWNRCKHRHR
jgi:hypothetical protein